MENNYTNEFKSGGNEDGNGTTDFSQGGVIGPPPTEIYVYSLWTDVLNQRSLSEFDFASDLCLLPVIVGEKRVLMTLDMLPLLLCFVQTTESLESQRIKLHQEYKNISLNVSKERSKVMQVISRTAAASHLDQYSRSNGIQDTYKQSTAGPPVEKAIVTQDTLLKTNDLPKVIEPTVAQSISETRSSNKSDDSFTFSSVGLRNALVSLCFPMLDGGIFDNPPRSVLESYSQSQNSRNATGHVILNCLSHIHSKNISMSQRVDFGSKRNTELVDSGLLLQFSTLSKNDRIIILTEILQAHKFRPLKPEEILKLKTIPLFTCRDELSPPVSIGECTNGVYWCDSAAALAGLSQFGMKVGGNVLTSNVDFSLGSSSIDLPVILANESKLHELYTLLGVEELTPATVARKFTLPSLNRIDGSSRLKVMTGLAHHWEKYKSDRELVELLKNVQFIPGWMSLDGSRNEESELIDLSCAYRRPNELFSWKNVELLEVLSGPHESHYFCPPSLRYAPFHDRHSKH